MNLLQTLSTELTTALQAKLDFVRPDLIKDTVNEVLGVNHKAPAARAARARRATTTGTTNPALLRVAAKPVDIAQIASGLRVEKKIAGTMIYHAVRRGDLKRSGKDKYVARRAA